MGLLNQQMNASMGELARKKKRELHADKARRV